MNVPLKCLLLMAVLVSPVASPAAAANIPVRFSEGMTHGFLLLKTAEGAVIATGDLLQSTKNGEVTTRTVYRFKDGSLLEERVTFTQKDAFKLQRYEMVRKGPTFKKETEISVNRASGKYRVSTKEHGEGKENVLEDKLDLPPDLYNGMIPVIIKNLRKGSGDTIHMLIFTPTPRLIELEIIPAGKDEVLVGGATKSAVRYVLKPRLGAGLKFLAMLTGRMPPDNHAWVLTDDVPAFVKFEGQLYYNGPVWRIELASPRAHAGD